VFITSGTPQTSVTAANRPQVPWNQYRPSEVEIYLVSVTFHRFLGVVYTVVSVCNFKMSHFFELNI